MTQYETDMFNSTQAEHSNMVAELLRDSNEILNETDPIKMDLIHTILGIVGEAGELSELVKKHTMNGKDLDIDSVTRELGDIEFYLEAFRQVLNIPREDTLENNIFKLRKRYPSGYSNLASAARVDVILEKANG